MILKIIKKTLKLNLKAEINFCVTCKLQALDCTAQPSTKANLVQSSAYWTKALKSSALLRKAKLTTSYKSINIQILNVCIAILQRKQQSYLSFSFSCFATAWSKSCCSSSSPCSTFDIADSRWSAGISVVWSNLVSESILFCMANVYIT